MIAERDCNVLIGFKCRNESGEEIRSPYVIVIQDRQVLSLRRLKGCPMVSGGTEARSVAPVLDSSISQRLYNLLRGAIRSVVTNDDFEVGKALLQRGRDRLVEITPCGVSRDDYRNGWIQTGFQIGRLPERARQKTLSELGGCVFLNPLFRATEQICVFRRGHGSNSTHQFISG